MIPMIVDLPSAGFMDTSTLWDVLWSPGPHPGHTYLGPYFMWNNSWCKYVDALLHCPFTYSAPHIKEDECVFLIYRKDATVQLPRVTVTHFEGVWVLQPPPINHAALWQRTFVADATKKKNQSDKCVIKSVSIRSAPSHFTTRLSLRFYNNPFVFSQTKIGQWY